MMGDRGWRPPDWSDSSDLTDSSDSPSPIPRSSSPSPNLKSQIPNLKSRISNPQESPMDKVRIGVIGIGGMGSGHAKRIQGGQVPRAELTAVCDLDPERFK